jgi:hypothetical protein
MLALIKKRGQTLKKTKCRGTAKKISTSRKNVGGQPTKLSTTLVENLCRLIDEWNPVRDELNSKQKIYQFQKLSTADCLAHNLGITKPTLYAYANNYDGIYDTRLSSEFFNAVKTWQTKRNYLHQVMMPFWAAFPSTWIFMYKNFHNIPDINFNQFNIDASENITNIQDNSTNITDSTGELTYEEIQNEADRIRKEILRRRTRPEVVDTKGRLLPKKQRPD